MKRNLCIWLPRWPIQRLLVARPELKERPVVLYETRRGADRVVACSAGAEALGVTLGMPLAEAAALGGELTPASRAASLLTFPYDPLADRQALEALAEWCGQFSPTVGREDAAAPECLLLDISGLAHLFGGEDPLARRILDDFAGRGLSIRLAVADTLGAAWAAAHFHSAFSVHSSFDSSLALIPAEKTLPALRPLPLAALRLADETVELLRQLGIDRIGQLESLPRDGSLSRFGPELLRRWDQAVGRLAEPVPASAPSPPFEAHWSPEHPTARRETVEAALERLLGQVAATLLGRGRGAVQLECRLDCLAGESMRAEPVAVAVGLFRPSAAETHLWSLVRIQLERLRLPGPVVGIHVTATATAPLLHEQQGLFAPGDSSTCVGTETGTTHCPPPPGPWPLAPGQHAPDLAELVERLSSRLGHRAVLRVQLLRDAQPERTFRYEPMVGLARRRGTRRRSPAELPPRPLRLLPRPVAIGVASILADGPPVGFHFRGPNHRIARHWGPERIETGWWRGRTVGRDYYQIETTIGSRYWLFRRLRDGRWFLHGTFE